MIVVHHLNNSRSQRILWLLEELGLPYEIKFHQRDGATDLAPPELKAVHPLGKSPVVRDGEHTLIESGAIIDAILRRYGGGRLRPAETSADFETYQQWLHFAEGSAMLPFMLHLYTLRLGVAAAPLRPRIDGEIANHLSFIDGALAGRDWLAGEFSGADIQMSFVGEIAGVFGRRRPYAHVEAWTRRLQARPAYQAAVQKGGPYAFGA